MFTRTETEALIEEMEKGYYYEDHAAETLYHGRAKMKPLIRPFSLRIKEDLLKINNPVSGINIRPQLIRSLKAG